MCKTNIILKTVFLLAFILITIFSGYRSLFWPLLIYLAFLTIRDRNIKAFILDLVILLILLFAKFTLITRIILTILMIINILIIYFTSYTKDELSVLKEHINYSDAKNRRITFYKKFENKVKESCEKKSVMYDANNSKLEAKAKRELDNLYLYSKVRFNGYDNKMTSILTKWTMNDLLFLLVSLAILIFLRIIWS